MGSTLLLLDNKFVLNNSTKDQLDTIKSVAGATFSYKIKAWTWKADYKTYTSLVKTFPQLIISSGVKIWVDKYLRAIQRMLDIKDLVPILKSENVDKLYEYQKYGVNFMIKGIRVICADDMGIGKTCQSIVAAEEINAKNILIITPNSVKFNWEIELTQWGSKSITIINGEKNKRKKLISNYKDGYMVINYESVRIHPELADMPWDVIIYDEAHRLKNRKAHHTEACKNIKSKYCWLLTGTPMENAPQELWSLLNMLFPDTFSSYWKFIDQYCVVENNEFNGNNVKIPLRAISPIEIYKLIKPIMIRRLKKEVLSQLPEKQYITIPVEMKKDDRRVYDEVLKDMITVLDNGEIAATPTVIAQFTRLKQICISQHLLGTKRTDIVSAKLEALETLVESCMDLHKIVIFTTFAEALHIVRRRFEELKWKTVELHGKITPEERQKSIDRFINVPDVRIFLATIQAGGTGIDGLQRVSDICIFLDKHPNPMKNLQAEDRLMRLGQKNALTIYNIVNKDSIEEYIEYKLLRKEISFNHIIEGKFTFLEKYFGGNLSKYWNV